MNSTRRVGELAVSALHDSAGPFFLPRSEAFPDATEDDWDRADALDPEAGLPGDVWNLQFRSFAIRAPGAGTILVDTGIGPRGSPSNSWTPVPGVLPASMVSAGITIDEVTRVVLTHLHGDHVGWAVIGPSNDARPYFPNAEYFVQRGEIASVREADDDLYRSVISPLAAHDQLSTVDGDLRLDSSVRIVATPGHTPGHQSVIVEAGESLLILAGDVFVHAVQLLNPEVDYMFESDPEAARRSRHQVLGLMTESGGVLGTAHLSDDFVEARESD